MNHSLSQFYRCLTVTLMMAGLANSQTVSANDTNLITNLTLQQAIDMAERLHPKLAEIHAMVEASEGRIKQAGSFPNPEAIVRAEQLSIDGGGEEEFLAGIAQPIPLSGRRGKARQVAELEREVRWRGLDVVRRNLHGQVHDAYATALYQDSAFQTWQQISENVEGLVKATKARVEAGDIIASELARIEMEQARATVELKRVQSMQQQSMVALAGAIGDTGLPIQSLEGSLEMAFDIPALETIAQDLTQSPEVALAESQIRAAEAQVDLTAAERIPDIKVEALYHRLQGAEANTFDIGLSIPLPIFNTQRGRLREARAESYAAEARARTIRNETRLSLEEAKSHINTALTTANLLKSEVLPKSESILQSGQLRYEAGDISLADLLPMRRDYETMRLTYLESLRDVMQAWAEFSRLGAVSR